jgi:hypothetical protein
VVDTDRSVTDSTITVIHEDEPRYIAARAKYDTGSDFNFTSSAFVTKHRLSALLETLEDAEVFVGLNSQEYHVKHTVVLHWCASTMHKTRTTTFFVADGVPYDILLGNKFIIQNGIFEGKRAVLALRHKHRSAGTYFDILLLLFRILTGKPAQREKEEKERLAHEALATEEQQRIRAEDARRRAVERENRKMAKQQTPASSMSSGSTGADLIRGTTAVLDSTAHSLASIVSGSTDSESAKRRFNDWRQSCSNP